MVRRDEAKAREVHVFVTGLSAIRWFFMEAKVEEEPEEHLPTLGTSTFLVISRPRTAGLKWRHTFDPTKWTCLHPMQ